MKKLLGVIVLSWGLISGVASADDKTNSIQDTLNTVGEIPTKIGNHISLEIENTKEFQKKNWLVMKAQFSNLISKFSRKQ